MAGCADDIVPDVPSTEIERYKGDKVMLAAGTTENSVSTRADSKTYYMPEAHRFVCKMYYKTNESGLDYDTLRYHTAWLKVDNGGAGNSLYWKSTYPETAQKEDTYHNDEYAPTFYWQNRKEHAFLAWTDLNHATTVTGADINFDDSSITSYEYHTGIKEQQWIEKNFMVNGLATPFTSFGNLRNAAEEAGTSTNALTPFTTEEKQKEQQDFADALGEYPETNRWKWYKITSRALFCTIDRPDGYYQDSSYETIDDTHRKSKWYKMTIYDTTQKTEYTGDVTNTRTYSYGTVVVGEDGKIVAVKVNGDDKFYECDEDGYVTCPKKHIFCYQVYETKEQKEITEDYPALAFDLLPKPGVTKMADQPDILEALTIDQIPTSAIMENNRVNLYFKHQFAQIQVNLKNSADNSVEITADNIKKVELLGVTEKGYVFTSMNPDGTLNTPADYKSSTFKEVVATDFSDEELETNPYGTTFNMFNRTLTDDEKTISKIVKSYECITYGRLQAIRITWQEDGADGIVHEATYRVPEKNDQNQSLRLLEPGVKYIWNMELRRGTLAVIRTDIIPWELNQVEYNTDGFIDTTSTSSSN